MQYVINDHIVLSRPPDGPLATQLGAFAASRTALGYARSSIRREIRLAAGFSHWLTQEDIALRRIDAGHVARYLRHRRRQRQPGPGDENRSNKVEKVRSVFMGEPPSSFQAA